MIILLLAMLGSASASATDLEEATQREFAYLRAEKAALHERIEQVGRDAGTRTAAAEGDIRRLQSRLVSARAERERVEALLLDAEREQASLDDQRDLLESTLFQADATLAGFDVPEGEPVPADQAVGLRAAFDEAGRRLAEGGAVRTEAGAFFLVDGTEVQGELIRVGQIATYGVSSRGAGTLVPVGDGRLQLRDGPAGAARALAAGRHPDTLGVFLHEGTERRIEEAAEQTWSAWLEAAGVVGLVIVALGVAGSLLAAFRMLGLMVAGRGGALVARIAARLDAGELGEARAAVSSGSNPTARVVRSLLGSARPRTALDDVAAEAILAETPAIERFGRAILVIAAVAPLLGLLGTVTGMIGTFEIITEFGTGDPRMLSGGISEALITTQLGLIVAIPMLLIGNLLDRMAQGVLDRLELAALTVINRVGAELGPRELEEAAK
ncbi:MAG: biopolymer transport protein ExbB [Myxococcota bacterium]|jgi:biopolymer transport protein ExbB